MKDRIIIELRSELISKSDKIAALKAKVNDLRAEIDDIVAEAKKL